MVLPMWCQFLDSAQWQSACILCYLVFNLISALSTSDHVYPMAKTLERDCQALQLLISYSGLHTGLVHIKHF